MGATNIEIAVSKENYDSPQAAFDALTIKALEEYGTDPYSGTIATTDLVGKVEQPSGPAEYENTGLTRSREDAKGRALPRMFFFATD